jgi:hypothetical protein
MKEISGILKKHAVIRKPSYVPKMPDDSVSKWIDQPFSVECSYAKLTLDKIYREPVFLRLRPDLDV